MLSRAVPWPDVDHHGAWTRAVLDWVDADYGPVKGLTGIRMASPEPAFWVFSATLSRTPVGRWFGGPAGGAAGTSVDAEEALVRCLGEVAERYSALTAPIEPRRHPVDPALMSEFPRCAADEDCADVFKDLRPQVPVTHVQMSRLVDDAPLDVPAGFAHLSFQEAHEPLLTFPVSTGLAFDPKLHTALWRGLCEVGERDAMMLTWWQRRPVAEIILANPSGQLKPDTPDGLADRIDRLSAADLTARFFDITTDFAVPTVCCVLTGESFPYLAVGVCSRHDVGAACTKALDEAVSIRVAVHGWDRCEPPDLDDFGWLVQLEQHAQLYATGRLRHAFDFMLNGVAVPTTLDEIAARPTLPVPCTMADLRGLATDLQRIGLTVLWADMTADELRSYGHVVKVVVAQMIPLSQPHGVRWLGTPRLRSRGQTGPLLASSFNPFPHPFS